MHVLAASSDLAKTWYCVVVNCRRILFVSCQIAEICSIID